MHTQGSKKLFPASPRLNILYHFILWVLILIAFVLFESTSNGLWFNLSNSVIVVFFFIVIVYFNLYFLIPKFLDRKNFLLYGLLLVLSALTLAPIRTFIMQWKLDVSMQPVNIGETFLALFIFGGFSTIVNIVMDWNKHQRERVVLETKNLQTELKSLRNQINPHFLFNTLNNIYALSLKKSDRTPDMIIKLSEMMRYMLYECNERFVPLENEISYLKNYLDLEHLRQGENFSINFDIDGEILDQKIAPMLIIPFVENCFKHGVNRQLEDGYVDIQFKIDSFQIRTIIKNSKPPDQPTSDHRISGGIGLLNVKKRLDLLYKGLYILDIQDEPESFFVDLTLKNN